MFIFLIYYSSWRYKDFINERPYQFLYRLVDKNGKYYIECRFIAHDIGALLLALKALAAAITSYRISVGFVISINEYFSSDAKKIIGYADDWLPHHIITKSLISLASPIPHRQNLLNQGIFGKYEYGEKRITVIIYMQMII